MAGLAGASDDTVVFSGASGVVELSAREKSVLGEALPGATIRGYGGVTGHGMEAQFPLGLALAALALVTGVWLGLHVYELVWWREARAESRSVLAG